jgi:glycosyltransferase involved in cell wall biosynthesis
MTARGHHVTLVAPGGTLDPDMLEELDSRVDVRESQVDRRERLNVWNMGRLTWSLARAVPSSDVVISTHTPTTVAGLIASRLLGRGRLVWLYQDYQEMFTGRPYETWLARNALRWHKLALVPGEYSRQELTRHVPDGEVIVMGYGLSHTDVFRPLPAGERQTTNTRRTILFMGDMRPRKGLYDFLEATALVYEQVKDVRLLIVSKEDCHIQSDLPYEYVHRPEPAELARLYATCDVFVLAAWWESFGLPPLEAMACCAPVVLTDTRGAREYARPGENCLMVPIRDPGALAGAIIRVLNDDELAERFRRNGPLMAAQFTWDKAVDRLERALDSVL